MNHKSVGKKQVKINTKVPHEEIVDKVASAMFDKTHLVYLDKEKNFYYWDYNKKVWREQGNSFIMKLFNNVTPRLMPNKSRVYADSVFQLKLDTITLPKNFEPDKNYLYFSNDALNLEDLDEDAKSKDHNIRICLDTELDLKAKPPMLFISALQKALPNPLEMYDCLQALSSVLLIRTQRIEKAFFFLGSGGNGKSTIMKVIDNIFGSYIAHVDMLDLQKDGFSKTALVDKLANSFSEISKMKQRDVGVFKAIASGDTQSVNSKFKERFDSVIKVIQYYSSNQMPEIEEVNEGFIRRAHPIEFNQKIIDKDPYIDDKLNTPEERKKILALLIRIARTTKRFGFLYEKTFKEKENILLKKTNPITEFLTSGIVFKREGYSITKKDLYSLYAKYCEKNKFRPQNTLIFSRFMTSQGFTYKGRNENPHWENLGVPPKDEGQREL
jgi:P4 family phage/plasmid primase-like protien